MSNAESGSDRRREIEEEARAFEEEDLKRVQPWQKQITLRGVMASVLIGSIFSVIAMKLNLTTGITPNLNVSAALLAFIFIRGWTKLIHRFGFVSAPFTKQENTMIQTCIVACYSISVGGGFGSYLLGMNRKTFELSGGTTTVGNTPNSIKEPGIGWMTGFLFLVCFIGLFVLIPLRKILIIDYKLTFPSGMATAVLINGFHNRGDKMAKKQVKGFLKSFSFSFLWGFFQWFYTATVECGFSQFPTFGLQAWKQSFYFDFSLTYVGTGMICPHIVNISLLLGAVLSYGMMWPLLHKLRGDWFPSEIPESSMKSLNGYKVFISIALLLGDGLYNFAKILYITVMNFTTKLSRRKLDPAVDNALSDPRKDEVFMRDTIPLWVAALGYVVLALTSVVAIPFIIPELKWYFVVLAYVFAPSLAFCNAYGAGLTDINMSYNYGKVGLFTIAALSGKEHGVVAALAACGIFKSIVNVSCILMQDFKTGHLTLTSPRAMLLSQAIGTGLGCIVSPLSFFLFYKAFDIGNPDGEFKAPYAIIYRNLAIIGVQGFSALPQHCLQLCYGFFAFAIAVNLVTDVLPRRVGKWMPLPTAMAVPFLIGGYFAIDMCVGSLVVYLWHRFNPRKADLMVPAVASGFICGEGIWSLPASVLALAKVTPPICMKFLPA
ncbi:metal-nicotianamine transporter YSL3-like isoform X3 [Salvia hispanica]|nr:metal-nicotianamine transporter YSL3-like isoform X3 [Salvia hispanica]XP_047950664.1 metal-nicotianamine transporter YSL3-like isoform X3 [Salvia hispanica]XP_047950665.1 metal-nicotianamine transporter YSL3-like isoform X3 [Salvia hispanica]XP_047950666.1 metal-nicotianamine transporter YSL3-like isoform X3 [Salvia hispanica]